MIIRELTGGIYNAHPRGFTTNEQVSGDAHWKSRFGSFLSGLYHQSDAMLLEPLEGLGYKSENSEKHLRPEKGLLQLRAALKSLCKSETCYSCVTVKWMLSP